GRRQDRLPDTFAEICVGKGKLDNVVHASSKGVVHITAQVGGENDDALVLLHLLQQVGDFNVGVAIVRVLHFGAFAEERVGLIEEEDGVGSLGFAEDLAELLFGFANVLADYDGEVDAIKVEAEVPRNNTGGHGFPRPADAAEQDVEALAGREALIESPLRIDGVTMALGGADIVQLADDVRWNHQAVPGGGTVDLAAKAAKAVVALSARCGFQVVRGAGGDAAKQEMPRRFSAGLVNGPASESEALGDALNIGVTCDRAAGFCKRALPQVSPSKE